MSIADHFGKRKQEPTVPAIRPTVMPSTQHEQTAQALAFVTRLNNECEALREENSKLRADLNLSRMRCTDVERDMQAIKSSLEMHRRYSVEIRTHLGHIVDSVQRANEAAMAAGEVERPDRQAERVIAETEREMRIASGDIAAKYGANGKDKAAESPPKESQ